MRRVLECLSKGSNRSWECLNALLTWFLSTMFLLLVIPLYCLQKGSSDLLKRPHQHSGYIVNFSAYWIWRDCWRSILANAVVNLHSKCSCYCWSDSILLFSVWFKMSLDWLDYRKYFSLIIWFSGLSQSVLCISDRFCIYLCRELNWLF